MGMINCKECGYRLSDKAKSCPNCGAPIEVANPPKKPPVKKKWWQKDCNGWKFATYISSFLFVVFFIAFLTKINSNYTIEQNNFSFSKANSLKSENNISSPSLPFSFNKGPYYDDIKEIEKKHKKMLDYYNQIRNGVELAYRKVIKTCEMIDDYALLLKDAEKKKIVFDNNQTIKQLIKEQKKFQKIAFPKLRKIYAKVVKMKFFAVLRSAVGGGRKKKIIFEATIFANEREIDKFHKIILNDLKKLRFQEAIYVLDKKIEIPGTKEKIRERKGLIYEIDFLPDDILGNGML